MRRQAMVTIVASAFIGLMMGGASGQEPLAAAEAENSGPMPGCPSNLPDGEIGMLSLSPDLVGDGALNAPHPEARLYDALQDGELRVVSVEFLMLAED
jgi:hypothetical protein